MRSMAFMWTDNCWILSQSKANLEQVMKELVGEAKGWDLEPNPASLWWPSTFADEKAEDIIIRTVAGEKQTPLS